MKIKIQKLIVITLTMIGTLTQIGCGQVCSDIMTLTKATVREIDVQNISVNDVSMTAELSTITLSLAQELKGSPGERIEFQLLKSFVGETQTVTFEHNLIKVGNESFQWDGTATITIAAIRGNEIDYSYSIDVQTSGVSESENAVIKIDGETSYVKDQICRDPGPS